MYRRAFRAAFPATVPVLMGYLSIGIAFGLMLEAIGYNVIWAFFMSLTIYAGSGQYMGVELLSTGAALGSVAVLTLILNFRHLVYGLSMLEKVPGDGASKALYDLLPDRRDLCAPLLSPGSGTVDPHAYYFAIAVLDHGYWILGSVIGSVAGALISFDTTGIDFAMTALFIVIAVDQWKTYRSHLPALLGCGITVLALVILKPDAMLIPALCVIVVALLLLRARLDDSRAEAKRR